MRDLFNACFWFVFFSFLCFGGYQWLHFPLMDVVNLYAGILTVSWLVGITTVPWNLYFKSLAVLDLAESLQLNLVEGKNAPIQRPEDISWTKKLSSYSISIAISLHIITSVGMFLLAFLHIWPLGYYAAVLSVLLSFLRPADHFYRYCKQRLDDIKNRIKGIK